MVALSIRCIIFHRSLPRSRASRGRADPPRRPEKGNDVDGDERQAERD